MNNSFNNLKYWITSNLSLKSMSVKELADKAGISRTIIYMYLNDEARPTYKTLGKLCEIFNIPVEEGLLQFTPNTVGRPRNAVQVI